MHSLIYNEALIKQNIEKFKNRETSEPTRIMFDADNTLYRFSTYKEEQSSLSRMHSKGFFKMLPIFEEAPYVIETLQRIGIECGIITTAIDSPYCIPEKMESFQYYFPMIPVERIHILQPGVVKTTAIKDVTNTLLVDDFRGNINDWYEAGGVAIKKSYSGKLRPVPVVTNLIDMFAVCHELNILRRL